MNAKYYFSVLFKELGFFAGVVITVSLVSLLKVGEVLKLLSLVPYSIFTYVILRQGSSAFGEKYWYGPLSFFVVMFSPISCVVRGLICSAEILSAPTIDGKDEPLY